MSSAGKAFIVEDWRRLAIEVSDFDETDSEKSTLRRHTPPNRRRPSSDQIQEL
jgi:hypothetical protein